MKYGISNLSIVPMRDEAADHVEMVNQILFGEHFKILESRKKWSKIRLSHDNYEGWISNKQWIEIEGQFDTVQILTKLMREGRKCDCLLDAIAKEVERKYT